jgi:hypothetical protein
MAKFLFVDDTQSTDQVVRAINYEPDNPNHGVPAEYKTMGLLVEVLEEPDPTKSNMIAELHLNCVTGEQWYIYYPKPLTQEEKISELQSQSAQMLLALVMGGLM